MKTPDYMNYDRYKNKKESAPKYRFHLFIGTFIVSLFAVFIFAKVMAPDVDVSIGEDTELEEKSIGLGVKQFVDERLKSIELDDIGIKSTQDETQKQDINKKEQEETVEEEVITLPKEKSAKAPTHVEEPDVMPDYTPPRPDTKEVYLPSQAKIGMLKVYVGRYSNRTQADVAKDILMDSGLNVSPFVKNVNGIYTLQIGSFSDKSRAEQIAGELTKNGFPARIVQE